MEASLTESQVEARKKKREQWQQQGHQAYPTAEGAQPQNTSKEVRQKYLEYSREALETLREKGEAPSYSLAGRVVLHRSFGKSSFLTLQDRCGRLQLFAQKKKLSEEAYQVIKNLDLGDVIYASGTIFRTKTDELTLDVENFQLLTKSIRPLPEKFHGLQDVEQRYRQRYLDLICNPEVSEVFQIRARLIRDIRLFFEDRDYLEVETPMLHPIVGGAAARPFKTYHNTLKMNLFLRIAPELYLKRLIVGGFDRVFEMNRCFRNEGVSVKHNPEFTMLEFYQAYATYEDLMRLTEGLLERLSTQLKGTLEWSYQGQNISFKSPFRRWSFREALLEFGFKELEDRESLASALAKRGVSLRGSESLGELQWQCFEEFVEGNLIQPTFIMDHPLEISPLARKSESKPTSAERFELYIAGREIANGFNELNDPEDQEERFRKQVEKKKAGDEEATDFDEDYIQALQFGLPPTAGEGIGIDRLVMLFADCASIRDVILFPQLRPMQRT